MISLSTPSELDFKMQNSNGIEIVVNNFKTKKLNKKTKIINY